MATPAEDRRVWPPSPLWAILVVVFLGHLGTGAVTIGVYFLTEAAYGFSSERNYWLGLVMGGSYIVGALTIEPGARLLAARFRAISTRAVLAMILGLVGLVCFVPSVARAAGGAEIPPEWTIWAVVVLFGPLTGALWPICESFISSGRRGRALRRATARFNITWGAGVVLAYWLMAPLLDQRPLLVIALLGVVHLLLILPLARFYPEPGSTTGGASAAPEPPEDAEPISIRKAARLLAVFRAFLPVSYVLMTLLLPHLPATLGSLGLSSEHGVLLASIWLVARLGGFIGLERWHGWHGRWSTPAAGAAMLLVGSACCLAAPVLGPGPGHAALLAGLLLFGLGAAVVYTGSLYYAMEVGDGAVGAGGAHEAMIGSGYAIGPACGLIALWLADGLPGTFEAWALGIGTVVCVVMAVTTTSLLLRAAGRLAD